MQSCLAHEFTLNVDDFGNILQESSVVYPRSSTADGFTAEQGVFYATTALSSVINKDETDVYLAGVPAQTRRFELGLPAPSEYLQFDDWSDQVRQACTFPLLNAALYDWDSGYASDYPSLRDMVTEAETDAALRHLINELVPYRYLKKRIDAIEATEEEEEKDGSDRCEEAFRYADEILWW